ncbi:sensor histidine kinase [Streptomyces sp. NPDC026672]|uniref:sensor histidine kinase n=1 Tax=unclassified Streptomyces TaxID=2593676 RepID=UPI003409AA26
MSATASASRRPSLSARELPHLVFLVAVAGTFVRLVRLNSGLCWSVTVPTTALAVVYVFALSRWDRAHDTTRLVWFSALVALWSWVAWIIPVPLAAGYAWLSVPLAVLAMRMRGARLRTAATGAVTVLLLAALARVNGGADPEVLAPPLAALAATVVLYGAQQRLTRQLTETRGELATQQRTAGRLAERGRIARDLHDTLAQELAGSRMLLQAAERDWDRRPDQARRQVRAVAEALGAHLAETRTIIGDLTPPALERDGLEAVLSDLCARTAGTAGAGRVSFRRERAPYPLATERAVVLLRVTQGLLANAREHARASRVEVVLTYGDDRTVTVEVRDDGRGFTSSGGEVPSGGRGYGLKGARERLEGLGGVLTLDSTPGRGTTVRATLPSQDLALAGS